MSWIQDNQILSGAGTVLVLGVGFLIKWYFFNETKPTEEMKVEPKKKSKASFKILFIDDESFKVVDILKKQGWLNTKRIRDVKSFEDPDVVEANVFFVDIQGVGKQLGFKDEGLGLSIALKNKFPEKKLVIYSAENKGDRFHEALKRADDQLAKNADPYEFQQLIESFFDKE